MNNRIILFYTSLLIAIIVFFGSCKKEHSCESCGVNGTGAIKKPPIARVGIDRLIFLPTDSVLLDGSASTDPDGSIVFWKWRNLSGNLNGDFQDSTLNRTMLRHLGLGNYTIELTVTDNDNLQGKDTLQITVQSGTAINHAPIAYAGPDQVIYLPSNSIDLDGSLSSDPDNNITDYIWTRISGPASGNIMNPNSVHSIVNGLVQGVYQFELKVTDAGGLYSMDTMQATVNLTTITCSNRPEIAATLIPAGNLTEARSHLVAGTAGNKLLFAGGFNATDLSGKVDIYDIVSNSWTSTDLSVSERQGMAVCSAGGKVFFAGGGDNGFAYLTSRVDIYDAASNSWSTTELSQARNYLGATAIGNKVFFAGGAYWGPLSCGTPPSGWPPGASYYVGSSVVDVYDLPSNTWSTVSLSEGRFELSATAAGNKVYFTGGLKSIFCGSTRMDVYDPSNNSWSTSELSEVKASHASISAGNKLLVAGGANTPYWSGYHLSDKVEIRDVTTGSITVDCFGPKSSFTAVTQNDNIVFFTGINNQSANKFDIYNTTTNSWSVGVLPFSISGAAVVSVNNSIYVAGGFVNGVLSTQVWKLTF